MVGGRKQRSCVRQNSIFVLLSPLTMYSSGHFNQKETPEAREELRLEMEDKEEERQKKAKKAMEEYEDSRKKLVSGYLHCETC